MKSTGVLFFVALLAVFSAQASGQSLDATADSIRLAYGIPEVGYLAVTADSVLAMKTLGVKRAGTSIPADPDDRFHLGSCTKAITGLIAGVMVHRNQIDWDAKFFDLCPELKAESKPAYSDMTLVDLLSHRAWLQPLMEEEEYPDEGRFQGDVAEQRYQFVAWVLTLDPVETEKGHSYSNAGYSAAAVMLERASGKTWEELVAELGHELDLDFGLCWPNVADSTQPWGHVDSNGTLVPTPPNDAYRLHWVEPAGDINMSISDYAKFLQMQLRGLQGRGPLLSQEEYEFLHSGMSDHYAIGWTWGINDKGHLASAHSGSADTFVCYNMIIKELDRAYAVFVNCASEDCDSGARKVLIQLLAQYGK